MQLFWVNMEREKLQETLERKKIITKVMEIILKGIKFRNKILVPKMKKLEKIFWNKYLQNKSYRRKLETKFVYRKKIKGKNYGRIVRKEKNSEIKFW